MTLKTFAPFHCSPSYKKLLKGLFMTKHKNFWIKNKIIYRFEAGFRKNYSTNTCLGHLTDKITTGFKKGLFTGMIFINLQKTFDTTDHQILIKKMKYLGFSKNVIAWFKSYLSERKFKINISTSYSSPSNLICGVPQRSILGQQIFKLCDWFVDNTLSVYLGQDKTKSILFGTKHKLWNTKALNIACNGTEI